MEKVSSQTNARKQAVRVREPRGYLSCVCLKRKFYTKERTHASLPSESHKAHGEISWNNLIRHHAYPRLPVPLIFFKVQLRQSVLVRQWLPSNLLTLHGDMRVIVSEGYNITRVIPVNAFICDVLGGF
jgi:hypothetical protein